MPPEKLLHLNQINSSYFNLAGEFGAYPRMTKLKLTYLIVALPLLGMLTLQPALAAGGAAAEAVRILTRARAADHKCGYLSAAERNELSRFTARAKIAAASQSSAGAAKSAAAAGRAEGSLGRCSADSEADVRETLVAARDAIAAAAPPAKAGRSNKKTPAMAADKSQRPAGRGLKFYAAAVRAYYLERRCRSLPRNDAGRFWRGIVVLHKAAVSAHGKKAVAQVMQRAQSSVRNASCGTTSGTEIAKGYSGIASR